jgi:hypothetical protein
VNYNSQSTRPTLPSQWPLLGDGTQGLRVWVTTDEYLVSFTLVVKKLRLHVSTGIGTVFITVKSQRSRASNTKPEREIDYLNKYHIVGASDMCTVHRNRTISRRYA